VEEEQDGSFTTSDTKEGLNIEIKEEEQPDTELGQRGYEKYISEQ
jgi:hypothetical protein